MAEVGRYVTTHKLGGDICNNNISIMSVGEVGAGGAFTEYEILINNPVPGSPYTVRRLKFQNGNPAVVGVNDLTNEALLAIVLDRLHGFQQSANCCRENALVITHLEEAQNWLARRAMLRKAQGVEGQANVPHASP